VQRLPPEPVTDEPDRDGDGLSDREETLYYYTNPVMADSDSDGLNDLEEVKVYGTDPNRFDSDSGGVRDGDEIARGADALDPGDDFVPDKLLEEERQPVATSVSRPMPSVFFPAGGVALVREARENLDLVVNYMRQHPAIGLELHGHSDSVGSRAVNLQLSRRRAEAVQAYLTALGIETRRLKIRALGESHPIASNATQTGRLENRRVELILAPR
jgi:outer membrane protein OmpA-like peptidoglycan-associated protein